MTEQEARVSAFALFNSKRGWLGGALYSTRKEAEEVLAEFNAKPSYSGYDCVIELNGEPPTKPAALNDREVET